MVHKTSIGEITAKVIHRNKDASNRYMATKETKLVHFPGPPKPEAKPTNLIDAGTALLTILKTAQRTLADYVHPEGITKEQAINDLLALLNGPSARKARDVWNASVAEALKPRK